MKSFSLNIMGFWGFVVDVKQGEKGPEVTLSRTHPAFVKMLFALEVPEIKERVVDIVETAVAPAAAPAIKSGGVLSTLAVLFKLRVVSLLLVACMGP